MKIEKIKSIKKIQSDSRRYDISVNGFHNFFANGILVHNCQNIPWVLEKYQDTEFYMTEKLDGSSMTAFLNNGEFGVCSRNLELKETEDNTFWKVVREMEIEKKMRLYGSNIALQGELIGFGIQKNPYKLKYQTIFFYNAYNIDKGRYISRNDIETSKFVEAFLMLPSVPIVAEKYILPKTMEEMLLIADGKSILNPDHNREGIVLRPLVEVFDPDMPCGGRLSFKVISNKYLLKNED